MAKQKNNPKLVGAMLNDVNADLISPTLQLPKEIPPRTVATFIAGVENPESKLPKGLYTIQQLLPDADPDQVDLAEATINGFQGAHMNDKPVFPDKEFLKLVLEQSGALMFLEEHFEN